MAVAIVGTPQKKAWDDGTSTTTLAVDCTGANALCVIVGWKDPSPPSITMNTFTYNAVSMTRRGTVFTSNTGGGNPGQRIDIFYQTAPSSGSHNVSLTASATMGLGTDAVVMAWAMSGVDQTTPIRGDSGIDAVSHFNSLSRTQTTVSGDMVLDMALIASTSATGFAVSGGQTSSPGTQTTTDGVTYGGGSYKAATTTSTTTSWGYGPDDSFNAIYRAVVVQGAAATNVNVTPTGVASTPATSAPTVSVSDSTIPTGVSITSSPGTITVTGTKSVSPVPTGISATASAGPIAVTSNYTGYPITAATALTTTDSAFQSLGFAPADSDRVYWPNTVSATTLTPETSGGNSTGRITSGPLTGTFTIYYYRLSNTTYYDRSITLVDGTITNITLTGQQIQSSGGASFVSITVGVNVTGQQITSSKGTPSIIIDNQDTPTGQQISVGQGSLTVNTNGSVSATLTGINITSSKGTLAASGNIDIGLPQVPAIQVGRGTITVTAQSSNATVNLASNPITVSTHNLSAVGNIRIVYITPNFVEYVLGNTNI